MLTIQEIFTKAIIQTTSIDVLRNIEGSRPTEFFDPYEANIYGTGITQDPKNALSDSDRASVKEMLKTVSLKQICEFLAKSGTTGISGAAYLIPDKVVDVLKMGAVDTDICAAISSQMLGPDAIPGASVKVDVAVDGSYLPKPFSSGGSQPEEEIATVQCTLTPASYGINLNVGNDLIEDSQFDIIQLHLTEAGRRMGEYSSALAATILGTAPDGDGTLNAGTSGDANETKFYGATVDIMNAMDGNAADNFASDTMLVSYHTMLHSILTTCGVGAGNDSLVWANFTSGGWPAKIGPLNVVYSTNSYITISGTYTAGKTVVFNKDNAIITGRKRWMRIERYSDPVRDLVGATVTARQDSISLYKDSIFTITET